MRTFYIISKFSTLHCIVYRSSFWPEFAIYSYPIVHQVISKHWRRQLFHYYTTSVPCLSDPYDNYCDQVTTHFSSINFKKYNIISIAAVSKRNSDISLRSETAPQCKVCFFKVYSNKGSGHKNLTGFFTGEGMPRFKSFQNTRIF